MRRTALLIGSQTHGLTGVRNDVDTMADQLARRGFAAVRREGPQATRAGILDGFERLIRDARDTDAVVVYYSGHGGLASPPPALAMNGRPAAARLQFIVPTDYDDDLTESDFRGITAPELSVLLARLTRATPNVAVILDACHSAHLWRHADLRVKALRRRAYVDIAEHLSRLRRHGFDPTIRHVLGNQDAVRLVACGREESAYEYTNEANRRTGVFTEALALALTEAGQRPVTWATLIRRVRDRVETIVPSQRPEAEGPSLRLLFQAGVSGSAQRPTDAGVTIEWGLVVNDRPIPLPASGATVHAGDHAYVRVRNGSNATVRVSLVHTDVAARVSMITTLDPSGIALRPGEEHVIGSDELDGRLDGIPLTWPADIDRGIARPETMLVLISTAPHDMVFRELRPDAGPAPHNDVHPIAFLLDPAPRAPRMR